MGDELTHIEDDTRDIPQVCANLLEQHVRRHRCVLGEIQTHIEFAEIRWLRILVQVAASGALINGDHLRIFEQVLAHDLAKTHRLFERRAGQGGHRHDEVAFLEFRQERQPKERQQRQRGNQGRNGNRHHQPETRERKAQDTPEMFLDPEDETRFLIFTGVILRMQGVGQGIMFTGLQDDTNISLLLIPLGQQYVAQRRHHGHRNDQ